ncbi:penicillin-binding protein [Marinilabilia sp.]|uniref:penicillin-binding protein n=1 Tax=Marinilabilia sp. TaxID=2021252 RepID=UPI0025BB0ADD|nr:penicillin-binding protein [Marinilabilia sp.]
MSIKQKIIFRLAAIYFVFGALMLWILFEVVSLKVFEASRWEEKARTLESSSIVIEANRGNILDEKGQKISLSVPSYRIYMDLHANGLTSGLFNSKVDSLALCLSRFFGDKSTSGYKRDLVKARRDGSRYYLVHPRKISYLELQKVREFPIFRQGKNTGGFIPRQYDERRHPFGSLASRTIGKLYGERAKGGMVGLERAYDHVLRGANGLSTWKRIAGSWIPEEDVPPRDGRDIITTLDIGLQDVAEQSLRNQLKMHDADHGVAILMEVETGAVKAMVNLFRSSPGIYIEDHFNYAIGEAVEPGSTFKLASIIAALEDGAVRLTDSVDTGTGAFAYYDRIMRDSHHGGFGKITVRESFEKSSNIGISRIIYENYKNNPQRFVDRLYSMGLNEPLGIEIKGEGKPVIKYPGDKSWSGVSLPWMSIGYEVKQTPLQTLAFYNAVANNGKLVRPMFVKGVSQHGELLREFDPVVLNPSICSVATLEKVQDLLKGVVERGTALNIRNKTYKIAGKTGTAQLAKGSSGYKGEGGVEYLASFVGYFPADRPMYSCIVAVNSPSNNVYYGNVVAGRVFREIADRVYALSYNKLDDDYFTETVEEGVYPWSKGGTVNDLSVIFEEIGFPLIDKELNAEWVSTKAKEHTVELVPKNIPLSIVPQVMGMGAKDAVAVLENRGLKVAISGFGKVVKQSITAGQPINGGETIIIYLE